MRTVTLQKDTDCPCRKCYPSRMPLKSAITIAPRASPATGCKNVTCPVAGEITIRQAHVTPHAGGGGRVRHRAGSAHGAPATDWPRISNGALQRAYAAGARRNKHADQLALRMCKRLPVRWEKRTCSGQARIQVPAWWCRRCSSAWLVDKRPKRVISRQCVLLLLSDLLLGARQH
jgi:hypothetical protein